MEGDKRLASWTLGNANAHRHSQHTPLASALPPSTGADLNVMYSLIILRSYNLTVWSRDAVARSSEDDTCVGENARDWIVFLCP